MKKTIYTITLAGIALASSAHAAAIYTLHPDTGPVLNIIADSSVTTSSHAFNNGGLSGADRYFYGMTGLRTGITESLSFSSTTHEFDLTTITWDYFQFSGGDQVDVGISVNGTDLGAQSTTTGDNFNGLLTWDASSVATASSYTVNFTIDEIDNGGGGNVSFFEFVDGAASKNGIVINGDITAIPEPSSAALLGLGGLALILRRRK